MVLVVDDNTDAADSLADLLPYLDCDPAVAYSGREALAMGNEWHPDLILLDIGMPGMDGFETARRMRDTPWGAAARIAALTAWNDPDTRDRVVRAGLDMHFVKPIAFAELSDFILSLGTSRDG
jgi:CheY-like chemotaxis protein